MLRNPRYLVVFLLFLFPAAAEEEKTVLNSEAVMGALATLEKNEYGAELNWWASDERMGREPGTPGSHEAAERAAQEFRRLGLEPMGDVVDGERSYFQCLDRGGKKGLAEGHRLKVGEKVFEWGKDWSLLGGCEEAHLEGKEIVFAGYGITAPEYEYDDYEGIDVRGKAVLVLRYEPREKDKDSKWDGDSGTRHATFRSKIANAEEHGAIALLFVNGPLHHDPNSDPLSSLRRVASRSAKIPMVHVRGNVADAVLKASGLTLREVQEKIDTSGKPASLTPANTRLDLEARVETVGKARNVIGLLEGSDPELKDEVVIIGAHYDHLGVVTSSSRNPDRVGQVYNGADDNASGSVGVVELAEAFVEGGLRPRRSVLFQLYDAEEKGLIGSRFYVEHPAVPLENTIAMLNMDMIARVRDRKCSIIGTGTAKEWKEILAAAEAGSPIDWNHREGSGGGSDHASFFSKELPVLFFNSGMHGELHSPDDDVDLCNMEGAVDVLSVVLKIALILADRDEHLTFEKPVSTRRSRARFGISTEAVGEGKPGLKITRIVPDSGAEKADLKKGDVILNVDGTAINGLRDLITLLRSHKPGDTVKVRFLRGDEENEADVVLGGL